MPISTKELKLVERAGVTVITLEDPGYPEVLKEIYDPSLCLYVRGKIGVLNDGTLKRSLAVVGSRRTTRYGVVTTENLTLSAVNAGLAIVSGLARGIDTIAHRVAVQSGGCTIAVLGGGLGYIYPQENLSLARAITDNGLLMSEQPMLFKVDKRSFPMRNRIISGLTRGTIVIEAGAHSGALITAQQALEQGRLVFAVPTGPHRLAPIPGMSQVDQAGCEAGRVAR